ncbi:MAG: hypothetical protein ACO3OV_07635 [Steroidobacteraceae bacterium]
MHPNFEATPTPGAEPPKQSPPPLLSRWRIALWGSALVALATPWFAMQGTSEVNWTGFDFAVVGVMLGSACVAVELAMRLSSQRSYRLGALLAVGGGLLMVWANLAVGIIGNEENPQNLVFFGVLLVGLIGAVITRCDAAGLARTLRVMAAIQLLIGIGAWASGMAFLPVFTLFYVALWLLAAKLFDQAATAST